MELLLIVYQEFNILPALFGLNLFLSLHCLRAGIVFFSVDTRPGALVTLCMPGSVIIRIVVLGKPAIHVVCMTDIVFGGCFAF